MRYFRRHNHSIEEICEGCKHAIWHICEDCYKSFCHCEIGEEDDVSKTTGSCESRKDRILW